MARKVEHNIPTDTFLMVYAVLDKEKFRSHVDKICKVGDYSTEQAVKSIDKLLERIKGQHSVSWNLN